jgi:hypothetical protein
LATKLLQVLEAQRQLGGDSYPVSLRRLAEIADPSAAPDVIFKAAGKKPFAGKAIVAVAKNLDSPVALVEDAERLAAHPSLLQVLLESVCTSAKPTCDPGKLSTKVARELKLLVGPAIQRHLQENTLPAGIGAVTVKGRAKDQTHLHLLRHPLPIAPDLHLAEQLLSVLGTQRQLGEGSYPVPLRRLLKLIQPGVDPPLLKKAMARPEFREKAILALKPPKDLQDSLVARVEDLEFLAESPLLLEAAIQSVRTPTNQVIELGQLKKKVIPKLEQAFTASVQRRIEEHSLPAIVGSLLQGKGKQLLFLTADINSGKAKDATPSRNEVTPPAPAPAPVGSPVPFAQAFDEAFRRIEEQQRHKNLVNLVDLRRALSVDRAVFDAGLRELRMAGHFTLSAADGRHGIGAEEQEAGITEDGALLLYVSRKLS